MFENTTDGGKVHADAWSTERAAADEQTTERKRRTYEQIVKALRAGPVKFDTWGDLVPTGDDGLTDDELRFTLHLATGHPQSKSGPATRRGELVELGYVRPQRDERGEIVKRPSDLGKHMNVWELVPADEYVRPTPTSNERQPSARGLEVARRFADWDCGDPELANGVARALLNPEIVAAELDDMGAL